MRALARARPVSRISISLPEDLLSDLDRMVETRGFESRSQAVNDMLHQFLLEHKCDQGDDVMVGIVALLYNNSVPGLQKQLADLQFQYIDEVISSLHVHLMHNQTMEVILVQGPARKLQMNMVRGSLRQRSSPALRAIVAARGGPRAGCSVGWLAKVAPPR